MKSIFSIFKRGLEKTTTKVARTIGSIFTGVKAHSAESFDELEELLIAADFGVPASLRIVGEIRDRYERGAIATNADLARIASETVKDILRQRARAIHTGEPGKPTVILMVGVNGSGKTTTIGKLAAQLKAENKKVILAACDTFRATAVEQLQTRSITGDVATVAPGRVEVNEVGEDDGVITRFFHLFDGKLTINICGNTDLGELLIADGYAY